MNTLSSLRALALVLAAAGCTPLGLGGSQTVPSGAIPTDAPYGGVVLTAGADTVRPAPRAGEAALADAGATDAVASSGTRESGRSTLSLGDPSKPGLWIETSLVSVERPGRVTVPSNGRALQVTLRPGPAGGGARASLQALQTLGLSPAALTEVVIYTQ